MWVIFAFFLPVLGQLRVMVMVQASFRKVDEFTVLYNFNSSIDN